MRFVDVIQRLFVKLILFRKHLYEVCLSVSFSF